MNLSKCKHVKKRKSRTKTIFKNTLYFLLFQLAFTSFTFPIYLFYGPFKDVRNLIVGMSIASGNHKYIAQLFLSEEKINEIINEENNTLNSSSINAPNNNLKVDFGNNDIAKIAINTNKFDGTALIIKDPSKVKVGYSSKIWSTGQTLSLMAKNNNAVAAINGGGYEDVSPNGKSGGTGGNPTGILISNGKVISPKTKQDYDKKEPCVFGINDNGVMYVGPGSINSLLNKNIKEAISFSPTLVVNGDPYISESSLVGVHPRTAIGQRADKSIILLVIDGRQGLKLGATLKDVQSTMLELGAVNAMCLDGGGSTTMYFENKIINNPSSITGERAIPSMIYVTK